MGVRDHLDRVAAWFGFGVEDDYYEEEEEERRPVAKRRYPQGDRYQDEAQDVEQAPAVRRVGRAERSSAFGGSLGDLFGGGEGSASRERAYGGVSQGGPSHLRPVPDQQRPQTRVSV